MSNVVIEVVLCKCEVCGCDVVIERWSEIDPDNEEELCLGIVCDNCARELDCNNAKTDKYS